MCVSPASSFSLSPPSPCLPVAIAIVFPGCLGTRVLPCPGASRTIAGMPCGSGAQKWGHDTRIPAGGIAPLLFRAPFRDTVRPLPSLRRGDRGNRGFRCRRRRRCAPDQRYAKARDAGSVERRGPAVHAPTPRGELPPETSTGRGRAQTGSEGLRARSFLRDRARRGSASGTEGKTRRRLGGTGEGGLPASPGDCSRQGKGP